jgi:hypothetical protein
VPKHTKEGTTNQLTGLLSECKGLAEGTWDARHENLEGIGLLPAETRDGAVLPIILEMINAGQIAPVVSSEEAGQDTIVYLQGIQGREHVKIGIYRGAMRCMSVFAIFGGGLVDSWTMQSLPTDASSRRWCRAMLFLAPSRRLECVCACVRVCRPVVHDGSVHHACPGRPVARCGGLVEASY